MTNETTPDAVERQYQDSDGNPCDLVTLCRREPGWAANRIDTLLAERARHAEEVAEARRQKELWRGLAKVTTARAPRRHRPEGDPHPMTEPNGATIEYTADDRLREMEALIEQQAERIRSLENELKSCTAELAEALKPPAGLRHPCIVAGEVLGAGNSQARAVVILQDRKAVMRLLETP